MEKKDIVDKFGQLPIEISTWLSDNGDEVKVHSYYLEIILKRLVYLKGLAPDHIAESDIPRTVEYLLSIIPVKLLNKYKISKKDEKH